MAKLGHDLDPVVMIGQKGLSQGLLTMLNEALDHHELIKIRFQDHKDQSKTMAYEAAELTNAQLVKTIGNIAMLYRAQKDPELQKIVLPKD